MNITRKYKKGQINKETMESDKEIIEDVRKNLKNYLEHYQDKFKIKSIPPLNEKLKEEFVKEINDQMGKKEKKRRKYHVL